MQLGRAAACQDPFGPNVQSHECWPLYRYDKAHGPKEECRSAITVAQQEARPAAVAILRSGPAGGTETTGEVALSRVEQFPPQVSEGEPLMQAAPEI